MNSQVLSILLSKVKIAVLAAALVGLATYAIVGINRTEAASTDCFRTATAKASISVSGGTATANFTIPEKCTPKDVTLVSYKAPNGTDGKPYPAQTVYKVNSKTFKKAGKHVIKVAVPDCYYQVDLVRGKEVIQKFAAGRTYTEQGRMITAKHGGKKSCDAKPAPKAPAPTTPAPAAPAAPTVVNNNTNVNLNENTVVVQNTTPTPSTPEAPKAPTPEAPKAKPQQPTKQAEGKGVEALPNTGPGETIAAFSFTLTFLSSMVYSYRNRFTDIVGSMIARF